MDFITATRKALQENKWMIDRQNMGGGLAVQPTSGEVPFYFIRGRDSKGSWRWDPTRANVLSDTWDVVDLAEEWKPKEKERLMSSARTQQIGRDGVYIGNYWAGAHELSALIGQTATITEYEDGGIEVTVGPEHRFQVKTYLETIE